MLFNLDFANNAIRSCFFFFSFFLIIELYFLHPAAITAINITAELVIPIGIPNKEEKAEMGTHPVNVEIKISKCSI